MSTPPQEVEPISALAIQNVPSLLSGGQALAASGIPQGLASIIASQCFSTKAYFAIRAGNKPRDRSSSPKPVDIKSKTSNHGFFRSWIPANPQFNKIVLNKFNQLIPIAHDAKDTQKLAQDLQPLTQLRVTFKDILQQIDEGGDLEVCHFDPKSGQLILAYREGHGPSTFSGRMVIQLYKGKEEVHFASSTPWDSPKNHRRWNPERQVIDRPEALEAIPKSLYDKLYHESFAVYSTETALVEEQTSFSEEQLTAEKIFAHHNPVLNFFQRVHKRRSSCPALSTPNALVIDNDNDVNQEGAEQKDDDIEALGVTGDQDGLALFYSPDLDERYRVVYNTFKDQSQIDALKENSIAYLQELLDDNQRQEDLLTSNNSNIALEQEREWTPLNAFLKKIAENPSLIEKIFSPSALKTAGCISPYEFTFLQLINFAHADPSQQFYGEDKYGCGLQDALSVGLSLVENAFKHDTQLPDKSIYASTGEAMIDAYINAQIAENAHAPNIAVLNDIKEHLVNHLRLAVESAVGDYVVPHPHYDHNATYLLQHGLEMRNPGKCNLEGSWLMFCPDGGILYGKTQQQLINVMLLGNFLKHNIIEVSPAADMRYWHKVIEKQLDLEQKEYIPAKALEKYYKYKMDNKNQSRLSGLSYSDGAIGIFDPKRRNSTNSTNSSTQQLYPIQQDQDNAPRLSSNWH